MKKNKYLLSLVFCELFFNSCISALKAERIDVGGGLGLLTSSSNLQSRFLYLGGENNQSSIGGNSISAHIFSSFEKRIWDKFLLGIEIAGNISNSNFEEKQNILGDRHILRLRYKNSIDSALFIGYKIKEDTTFYLKSAFSIATWDIESSSTNEGNKLKRKILFGLKPSVGLRLDLNESISTSFEYSKGFYRKLDLNVEGFSKFKIDPSLSTFIWRFSYKINNFG